jgi:hypothetical protein
LFEINQFKPVAEDILRIKAYMNADKPDRNAKQILRSLNFSINFPGGINNQEKTELPDLYIVRGRLRRRRRYEEVPMKKAFSFFILMCVALLPAGYSLRAEDGPFKYHDLKEIKSRLEQVVKQNKNIAALHNLGQTYGGRDIFLLELGRKESEPPAILVVANMEGDYPMASEAALRLAGFLTDDWQEELDRRRWYVIPVGNPDGYARFFRNPKFTCFVNDQPFNDDNDDATDEDGPEDLNSDGYITSMRQAHPEGRWIPVEDNPILMKKADIGRGEKGQYRLFIEGIDNDGDGEFNEDASGGVNPGYNFPHQFKHYTKTGGRWAASEPESRAIMRFAFDHPEIAMVLVLGRTNSLKNVPESSQKTEAARNKYKIPKWMAEETGLDPEVEYPLADLVEMAKEFTGYEDLTEEMVLQFLGVGAAVNPDRNDLPYWNEISERYNEYIKEVELDGKRLNPPGFSNGSIEEWAYYQYGVPTFSMDFWTLPVVEKKEEREEGAITPDDIENMSEEEFIELGTEKINKLLKSSGAPARYTADMVIMGLKNGMITTQKMAEMRRKHKKKEESGGADETEQALYDFNPGAFADWQPYHHPTLGKVEIGGMIPYSTVTPPENQVEELIDKQLPFVRRLAGLLPEISIEKIEMEREDTDIWRVEAWVANGGFLPYSTYQGKRCRRPTPAVATLIGPQSLKFLEGRQRQVLDLLPGSGGAQKVSWLVETPEGTGVTVRVHTFSAGVNERKTILKRGGGQ